MSQTIVFWHWWILGGVLILVEMLAPGFFFLWMGVSALAVGLVLWVFPLIGWEWQFLCFGMLSVGSIAAWRLWLRRNPPQSDQPALNRRGMRYVGRVFTLEAPIVNGVGKLRVDDTMWKIEGADTAAGARVRVTGVDGTVLKVEPRV
jgi:membrane protein implicated in regulation of membrane protease activity